MSEDFKPESGPCGPENAAGVAGFRLDFVGIGVHKSATTWLCDMLRRHPALFIPKEKELMFFNRFSHFGRPRPWRFQRGRGYYARFFHGATAGQLRGEFSNQYMQEEDVAERIHATFPEVKILAMLRNPIDRVHSHYWFLREQLNDAERAPTLEEAIARDPAEYLERGLYHRKLMPYILRFARGRILIMLHEGVHADRLGTLRDVCSFLEVDGAFYERDPGLLDRRINESKKRKSLVLSRLLSLCFTLPDLLEAYRLRWITDGVAALGARRLLLCLRDLNLAPFSYPPMAEETRLRLRSYFSEDIRRLEDFLGRSLEHWR